jgi:hypothetical protein
MNLEVLCPAGAAVHPVLSRNDMDVQCRIQGGLRPARHDDGRPVVCCSKYVDCRIWQTHKAIDGGPSTKAQRDETFALPHNHTLKHASRS